MLQPAFNLEKSLLIIEDDTVLRERFAKAMTSRGFITRTAGGLAKARSLIHEQLPNYVMLDFKLNDGYGFDLVKEIRVANDQARIVIVTGYGSIAATVVTIKHGAVDYLIKPVDVDTIVRAFMDPQTSPPLPPIAYMSPARARWEHIQRVFVECGYNISETARHLKMHRRSLQRILTKHPPK